MPGLVTNAQATAFSNQRKLDRASNGNLVALVAYTSNVGGVLLSTNGGVTWTGAGTGDILGFTNGSMFIDLDDFLHVVWKQSGTGGGRVDATTYYMRGTPNAARTSWTFGTAAAVTGNVGNNYSDIIAHREGTGWRAHIVHSYADGTPQNFTQYNLITITDAGAVTVGGNVNLGGNYGVNVHTFPSIDFNHTGDGKTVAGGTPHLYVGWTAGTTGAGKGVRFKKATYSAGSWTFGTERGLDEGTAPNGANGSWLSSFFDGTRFCAVQGAGSGGSGTLYLLNQRDAADTTTTTVLLLNNPAEVDKLLYGSCTYDTEGNVYVFGNNGANAAVRYRRFVRSSGALEAAVQFDQMAPNETSHISAKRGYSGNRIEWVWTSGNNSPYSVKYDRLLLPSGGPRMMV